MNGRRISRRFVAVALAFASASACILHVSPALALDPEVTADVAGQFYDVRSPTGEQVLARRRMTATVGASVFDLIDTHGDPNAPTLSFRTRVRYDADFGASSAESDVTNFGRVVPGYQRGNADIMYAYVEGRKFLHGWLGFKVGRQYVTDVLGWWSFDGANLRLTAPQFVAAELYGGLEQRGGLPLSSPRFEQDGVLRGDRSGYDPSLWPSYQPASIAPAFGAAVETAGLQYVHARATYRRVQNEGSSNVSEFANGVYAPVTYNGSRISSERMGLGADVIVPQIGAVKTGVAYDLYNARISNAFFSVDAYATQKLTLSIDYDFFQPTFDADSIWNFFQAAPMNDIGIRAACDATDKLSISGGAHVRMFRQQTQQDVVNSSANITPTTVDPNYYPSAAATFDGGGSLAAKYKFGHIGYLGLRGHGNTGQEGDTIGGDLYGERVFWQRYILEARGGLWQWNDKLRPDRDATSFGYTVGGGYRLAERSKVMLEFDHNINRIVGQRFRAMVWLTVAVMK